MEDDRLNKKCEALDKNGVVEVRRLADDARVDLGEGFRVRPEQQPKIKK